MDKSSVKQQVEGYLAVPPGIRCTIHVTTAMSMKTQSDAFIISLAKFTSLHSAAKVETPLCSFSSDLAVAKQGNVMQDWRVAKWQMTSMWRVMMIHVAMSNMITRAMTVINSTFSSSNATKRSSKVCGKFSLCKIFVQVTTLFCI
ncbi:hypothetical protein VPH35_104651 [Triticum aestivum]